MTTPDMHRSTVAHVTAPQWPAPPERHSGSTRTVQWLHQSDTVAHATAQWLHQSGTVAGQSREPLCRSGGATGQSRKPLCRSGGATGQSREWLHQSSSGTVAHVTAQWLHDPPERHSGSRDCPVAPHNYYSELLLIRTPEMWPPLYMSV